MQIPTFRNIGEPQLGFGLLTYSNHNTTSDNQVLILATDSNDRIEISSFKGGLCQDHTPCSQISIESSIRHTTWIIPRLTNQVINQDNHRCNTHLPQPMATDTLFANRHGANRVLHQPERISGSGSLFSQRSGFKHVCGGNCGKSRDSVEREATGIVVASSECTRDAEWEGIGALYCCV